MKVSACVIGVFFVFASGSSLQAQFSVGTWVQTAPMKGLTMVLKRVDDRRTTTVFKRSGKVFRTSTTTESADRMTMTVENEFLDTGDGRVTGKMTETYVRK